MKKELQTQLYEKYPKIFRQKDLSKQETAMCYGIGVGDGWYNIIDTLCGLIQHRVDAPHKSIADYEQWTVSALEEGNNDWANTCVENIEKEKELIINQVEAVQIKEKFGDLCFYINDYQPEIRHYLYFASAISKKTCEYCGRPGSKANNQNKRWIKTVCEECALLYKDGHFKK